MDDVRVYFSIYFLLSLVPATAVVLSMMKSGHLGKRALERLGNAALLLVVLAVYWPMVIVGFIPYYFRVRSLEKKYGPELVRRVFRGDG